MGPVVQGPRASCARMADSWEDDYENGSHVAWLRERFWRFIALVTVPVWGSWAVLREAAGNLVWFSPERIDRQFTYYRKVSFIVTLIWTILLWIMVIWKYIDNGVADSLSYFTNVALNIQAVYYTLDLLSYYGDPDKRELEMWLLMIFWAPVFAQAFDVFIMVLFVYLDNANIFTENLKCDGGKYDTGVVLLVERAVHVFPLFVGMIYYPLRICDISDFLIQHYGVIITVPAGKDDRPPQCIHDRAGFAMRRQHCRVYMAYQWVVGAVPFIVYVLVQNVKTVYGVSIFNNALAVLAVFVLNLFAIVLVQYTIIFYYIPDRKIPDSLVHQHVYDPSSQEVQITRLSGIPAIVPYKESRPWRKWADQLI